MCFTSARKCMALRPAKRKRKVPKGQMGVQMEKLTIKAMAKVNLGLDVIRRREDGYHEVKMIMQTVDLFDELTFEVLEENRIEVFTDNQELPCDEGNLIYRAAALLTEKCRLEKGIRITLKKNIPIAAGMAGGSTDAAATLVGMNRLFDLGLSVKDLQELGVKIGADVPYCIQGGTMLSEGIGEILSPLPPVPDCYVVVAKPEINVSTKFVYENLHAESLKEHPDIDGMIVCLTNKDLKGMAEKMGNVLETVTAKHYPVIEEIKAFLAERGALRAMMSGSGPTVFALFEEKQTARKAYEELKQAGYTRQVYLTGFTSDTCVEV